MRIKKYMFAFRMRSLNVCHVSAGFPADISVAQIECGLSLSTTDIINI